MKKLLCILFMLLMGSSIVYADVQDELEKEISAFEITATQRELAKENEAGYPVLDAGRGNPNWINTQMTWHRKRVWY